MINFSDKIDSVHRQEIELVIDRMKQCSKGYECISTRFGNFCKVQDVVNGEFIQCKEEWSQCEFWDASLNGNQSRCRCPLRNYLRHKYEE
jgi:hypothetical protein